MNSEKNTSINSAPARELLVISGKGGTGKTSLCASLAELGNNCVIADCDVDAANMHLLLNPQKSASEGFYSGFVAEVKADYCNGCGRCNKHCRFDAIRIVRGQAVVDNIKCEGCGVCYDVCPNGAIKLPERYCGDMLVSNCDCGDLIHAELDSGGENSGKLVSSVRAKAKDMAKQAGAEKIIIDGPPGVGCAVIASVSGVNYAVIVTEPSVSGIHDLERIIGLLKHFEVPCGIVVNKCDLDAEKTGQIRTFAKNNGLEILGELLYEACFVQSHRQAKTVVNFAPKSNAALVIRGIYSRLESILD